MFIDLDPNELKKVSINIEGYDDALNNDYFPNALQYVSNLVANSDGIKTEEVANLLRSIYDKLIFYSDSIKSNLNGLEEQIAESLEAYSISTEDAREKLAQLFLVMQEFVSSGKMDMSLVSSDGYMEEKDTVETLDDSQESSTQDGENVEIDAVTGAAPDAEEAPKDWFERASENRDQKFAENEAELFSYFTGENVSNIYKETMESENVLAGLLNGAWDTVELVGGAGLAVGDYVLSTAWDGLSYYPNALGGMIDDASAWVMGILNS